MEIWLGLLGVALTTGWALLCFLGWNLVLDNAQRGPLLGVLAAVTLGAVTVFGLGTAAILAALTA